MRGKTSACPAGLCFLFPSRQRQALIKFFGVEGEAAPFVHKRGAFPSQADCKLKRNTGLA